MEKQAILEVLDRAPLLLPAQLHEALAANSRVKYYLSLLQMACAHADAPEAPLVDLASERKRCGIDEPALDEMVTRARRRPEDDYRVPGLRDVVGRIESDLERMIVPLASTGSGADEWRRRLEALREREDAVVRDDTIFAAELAEMTSSEGSQDTFHRLCMELHKAIDALEARASSETIDGARVYGIEAADRPRISAFMRGIARTSHLKFDHPGLGTTATRSGGRLVIENDLGTTEEHVLVIEIEGTRATVTSTDVHIQRLAFFQRMFDGMDVAWEDTRSRRSAQLGDGFFLCVGSLVARDDDEMTRFLERLGSRIVFLIDWNRARKQLRSFVPKARAVALLAWAAEQDLGHRAFLELGGEQLVYDAMAAVIRTPLRFGERLDDALGEEQAEAWLRFVLREAAEGLLAGRSHSLIRERVRAELANEFLASGERLLEPAGRHAELVRGLAATLRARLERTDDAGAAGDDDAREAKAREREADGIVVEVRSLVERLPDSGAFRSIVEAADDAADELEDAVFSATLLPPRPAMAEEAPALIRHIAQLAFDASDAYVAALRSARHARRGEAGDDVRALLDAVDRIVTIERETDDVERHAMAALVTGPATTDPRVLFVVSKVVHHIEAATDALLHAGLYLRDHALGAVMVERP